jgi:tetratricopeptide (TPR) repeat protein
MSLALALAPSDPNLLAATALAELEAGLPAEAQRHAQQSKVLLPRSAKLRTLLGIAQFSNGYTEDAVSTLIEAIDLDPTEEPAYRCLSQIVLQSSASPPQPATAHLCRWNATVCSALKLRLSRETGDPAMEAEAIAGLKRAPPADPVAHCELARAWEWTGRLPEARAEMETCLKFASTPQNHYRMGLVYKRLGLDDLSRKEMEIRQQLLQGMPDETALDLNVLRTLR